MAGALAGEVAIVTGAGVNTGAVIAKTLARERAAVVVNYRNAADGARATVAAIEADGGRAIRPSWGSMAAVYELSAVGRLVQ